MPGFSSPDYPDERLIVCRDANVAAERSRKRVELLTATECDLARIQAAIGHNRKPLHGKAEIVLAVDAVVDRYKMRKHFDLTITDASFGFARKTEKIAAQAATDGIYIVRTSQTEAALDDPATVRSYRSQDG